jgi:CRISPR-associated protein Csh2
LAEDKNGEGVFIVDQDAATREDLALRLFPEDVKEMLKSDDLSEAGREIRQHFLKNAIDVRYFGATLSFDDNNVADDNLKDLLDEFSSNYTGPIQFSPALSLNSPVQLNEEYDSLTSVIGTAKDKETGGYDLDDKRIKYGIFPFYGVVNENSADDTNLSNEDMELFDKTIWRSIKNQTITRSKIGQEPRLYVRVEYSQGPHTGDLHHTLNFGDEVNERKLRSARDVVLNLTQLLEKLEREGGRIETVHFRGSDAFRYLVNGEEKTYSEIKEDLQSRIGEDKVKEVRVHK